MQELDFPVRLLTRSEDDIVLMVAHDGITSWYNKAEQKQRADKTREFCNWIRKTFPHVPTEFRYLGHKRVRNYRYRSYSTCAYRTVNSDKHFVAYGLKRNELMMIKLAFSYQTQVAEISGPDKHTAGAYIIERFDEIVPTRALEKRLAKDIKAKPVKLS